MLDTTYIEDKHLDYWYIILPSSVVPKDTWFNILQDDDFETVRWSNNGSRFVVKVKRGLVPQYILDKNPFTVGGSARYMCYLDYRQIISDWEYDEWNESETDGSQTDRTG
jgi:hypothetical protein